jgi:deoxyribodipyrimidine photolyase-related protein
MHTDEKFLFHSVSFAMNSKMPKEVIETVIAFYHANETTITISQVEGFVKYWDGANTLNILEEMPNYAQMNVLENKNKLPDFFWTGKTK